MIQLYSGTPGSGKSYHVARRVHDLLKYQRRRVIITNVQYNLGSFTEEQRARVVYLPNEQLAPDKLIDIAEQIRIDRGGDPLREGTILLILDEAQLLFNARSWQLNDNKGWIRFFTQHRKLGYDVLMIAQYDRMIDRQIRSLIEYEVIHRKISRFGVKGWVFSFFFGTFVAVSLWYGIKEVTSREFLRYRKRIARLYDTYQRW